MIPRNCAKVRKEKYLIVARSTRATTSEVEELVHGSEVPSIACGFMFLVVTPSR
jgi:hypothetical protein